MSDRIEVENLQIKYGDVTAVKSATFSVKAGEVLGMLGGNGAGKSSTLRALAGVNAPTGGRLIVAGHDMMHPRSSELARAAVGYCPDVGGLWRQLTVREHIELSLKLRKRKDAIGKAHALVDIFELGHVIDRPTAGFSHGMCRRLSVLLAAVSATDVLILDEPFDGVDPIGVKATIDVVQEAAATGVGVLISTHLLDLLANACDRIAVMSHGTLIESQAAHTFLGEAGAARYNELLRVA